MSALDSQGVFLLKPNLYDPVFEGLAFGDHRALVSSGSRSNDFLVYPSSLEYKIPRFAKLWDDPVVDAGRVVSFNDYPCCSFMPAFSARAVEFLSGLLEPHGELLRLRSDRGNFFAFNTTTIGTNLLDLDLSVYEPTPPGAQPFTEIRKYVFRSSAVEPLSIFRLREEPNSILVTNRFRNLVLASGLKGFCFWKLWPLKENEDWRELQKQQKKSLSRFIQINGKHHEAKEATVAVRFPARCLSNNKYSPLPTEIDPQLNAELLLHTPDEEYFGQTEGFELREDACDKLISCPHTGRLIDRLRPLLSSFVSKFGATVWESHSPFWAELLPLEQVEL